MWVSKGLEGLRHFLLDQIVFLKNCMVAQKKQLTMERVSNSHAIPLIPLAGETVTFM
jgi:hypothetical protein